MKSVFSLSVLVLTAMLSGCGDDQPNLSAYRPSGPLPGADETEINGPAANPEPPAPPVVAPPKPVTPSPVTPGIPNPGPVTSVPASPSPRPVTPPAPVACLNPIQKIIGTGRGTLAAGLLDNTPFFSTQNWLISSVQVFAESLDGTEQVQVRASRSQLAQIECQNTKVGSAIVGFASIPDSVMPATGQYSSWLEVAVGTDLNGIASAQSILVSPMIGNSSALRRIQDWRPVGATDSVRGIAGTTLRYRVLKLDVTAVRPGFTVLLTEGEVESTRGKARVYTRVEYSM